MRFRTMSMFLLVALAWSIASPDPCRAQPGFSSAAMVTPWNGYMPERIPNDFQTIATGNHLISESYPADAMTFSIPLPASYTIRVLGVPYTASQIQIGINGFIELRTSGDQVRSMVYDLSPLSPHRIVIMPYWSDLTTEGVTGGGVYYRIDPDMLTIEWRVQGMSYPPGNPGAFQVRIRKNPVQGKDDIIEFHYDTPPLTRRKPGGPELGVGAQIGLKNAGQDAGDPTQMPTFPDMAWQMVMLNPALFSNVAATRMRTMKVDDNDFVPEYYASQALLRIPAEVSPYFHYRVPVTAEGARVAYRMTPIIDDQTPTKIDFLPDPPAEIVENPILLQARIKVASYSSDTVRNVKVRGMIYRKDSIVMSSLDSIPVMNPGGTRMVFFGLPSLAPGAYRFVAIVTGPHDQNRLNDTISRVFFVRTRRDAMLQSVLLPSPASRQRFSLGEAVPGRVVVRNSGSEPFANLLVTRQILNLRTNEHFSQTVTLRSRLRKDETAVVTFPSWRPRSTGWYRVTYATRLVDDMIPLNDSLWTSPSRGIDVLILNRADVGVGSPRIYPQFPAMKQAYRIGTKIPVAITVANNGCTDQKNIPVRVQIRRGREMVYDRTVRLRLINGGGGVMTAYFDRLLPLRTGEYVVTARAAAAGDVVPANDVATWSFQVSSQVAGMNDSRLIRDVNLSDGK